MREGGETEQVKEREDEAREGEIEMDRREIAGKRRGDEKIWISETDQIKGTHTTLTFACKLSFPHAHTRF